MGTLTVILPSQIQQVLDIEEPGTLVYDGQAFVDPQVAQYVMLYTLPVAAVGLPFEGAIPNLVTSAYVQAGVVSYDGTPVIDTDPSLVTAVDPSGGTCVCFITCKGTWISYVKVTNQP